MEAPGDARGKWMQARGNGGSNLWWQRNKFLVRPTYHVNIEFLRSIMIPSPLLMSLNFGTFP